MLHGGYVLMIAGGGDETMVVGDGGTRIGSCCGVGVSFSLLSQCMCNKPLQIKLKEIKIKRDRGGAEGGRWLIWFRSQTAGNAFLCCRLQQYSSDCVCVCERVCVCVCVCVCVRMCACV